MKIPKVIQKESKFCKEIDCERNEHKQYIYK